VSTLVQDFRYGARGLLRNPGFASVALLTLALGIGANSAIFSFVNGIMLRPLPYQEPERLVALDETAPLRQVSSMGVSFPNFLDWRAQNHVFTDIAAYTDASVTVAGIGDPEQTPGAYVSAGTFEILGVDPIVGSTFAPDEDIPNQDNVAVISYALWQRRFGGTTDVLGKSVLLNGRQRVIIGVMPAGFNFPEVAEVWMPLGLDTKMWTRTDHGLSSIARLRPGVTLSRAREELKSIASNIEEQNPITNEGLSVNVFDLRQVLVSDYRLGATILLGVVGFVLLIACTNVANLLLARAATRQKEIAIRSALGAGRSRIFRQLLCESLVLGLAGGLLGLGFAAWARDLLLSAIPIKLPFWMQFQLDWRVLGFTIVVAVLTSIVFGAAPAFQAARTELNEVLKDGGRGVIGSRHRLRQGLVVLEVALSLVLLVGAGLMIRSFERLYHVSPGFNPDDVLTAKINLPRSKYRNREAAFFEQLMDRVRALPGVESCAAVHNIPLGGDRWGRSLTVEGRPVLSVGEAPMINHEVVTPGYFKSMGIPVMKGRDFNDADRADSQMVTIIDERLAKEFWPNEDPIGRRIRFGPPEDNEPWHVIVGVVGAVQHERLDVTVRKTAYLTHSQVPVGSMTLVVRSNLAPQSLSGTLRGLVKEADPDLPLVRVMTMNEVVATSVWQTRLYAILFAVFAGLALVLAAVGIYGVMSYSVAQRTSEIGIRVALGAQSRDVLKLTLGNGMMLVSCGIGVGLAVSFLLTRLMQGLLFNTSTADPVTHIAMSLVLAITAFVACFVPARRAANVDPIVALRYE
jgi:putative ABC transport system permease protein